VRQSGCTGKIHGCDDGKMACNIFLDAKAKGTCPLQDNLIALHDMVMTMLISSKAMPQK
jgi:hypothetical protein